MRALLLLACLPVPALAADPQPRPGEVRTFGDWAVGCDNGRACQANALAPDGHIGEAEDLMLVITRAAAPDAPAQLRFALEKEAGPLTLRVDGKPAARLTPGPDGYALPIGRATVSMLANGSRASVTDGAGKARASTSLKGLAAAFLYMDQQGGRAGTTAALRATGSRRPAPPPPLPRIARPSAGTAAPRTLTVAQATKLIGPDAATCDYASGGVEPEAHRLDAGHSLVLVNHPCGNGAYNGFSDAYVVDEAGRVSRARFDADPGMGPAEAEPEVVNAGWEAATRRLTSYAKGRGLGDCGSSQSFAWDGTRFRLVEQRLMGECRGSVDWIPVWRAEVVAR
jgi:hypothetical protein